MIQRPVLQFLALPLGGMIGEQQALSEQPSNPQHDDPQHIFMDYYFIIFIIKLLLLLI